MEATQASWFVPMALLTLGSGLLAWRGGRFAWLLCLVGLLWPLLFLGDWLTQTVVMALIALAGVASDRERPSHSVARVAGVESPDVPCPAPALWVDVAHRVCACVYLVAVFHKLNGGFFDGEISCAAHGFRQLGAAWPPMGAVSLPTWMLVWATVAVEVVIGLGLWFRRPLATALAAAFHIPLTLALAPAFAFVMAIGHTAALATRPVLVRPRRRTVLPIFAGGLTCSLALWLTGAAPLGALKAGALAGGAAFAIWATYALWAHRAAQGARLPTAPRVQRWSIALVALFVVFSLSPYTGLHVQHSGAMLSNLRVDDGCWNHFLVPEWVRIYEPYVRVEEAYIGRASAAEPARFADTEALLLGQLWSPHALRRMRVTWCNPSARPLRMRLTFEGDELYIPDLCADDLVIPVERGRFYVRAWFPRLLRVQKNLPRACVSACVH